MVCKRRVDATPWPDGFHVVVADGGTDRLPHVCENVDEVLARFYDPPEGGAVVQCAWCTRSIRTRTPTKAARWFREHDCDGTLLLDVA